LVELLRRRSVTDRMVIRSALAGCQRSVSRCPARPANAHRRGRTDATRRHDPAERPAARRAGTRRGQL
jgi:hypothetical protein